jgi:SAM-dependent methyltransferase
MCHDTVLAFGPRVVKREHVEGLRVLEVGSRNVNGSLRPYIESLAPASYVGVDVQPGPGVDGLRDVEGASFCFLEPFDLVVCTEVLEHVRDWRAAARNLKRSVRVGGHLLITTRSRGFKLHEFPGDYWRYSLDDMANIFADFEILVLESDTHAPGVLFYAQNLGPRDLDLSDIKLYAMPAPQTKGAG